MKLFIQSMIIITTMLLLQSCYKTGQINVKNDTELMMENVKWGDVLISERILTGETSKPRTIKIKKNDPIEHEIYFESTNDEYYIFAKTKYKKSLIRNELKTINIGKTTPMIINTKPR